MRNKTQTFSEIKKEITEELEKKLDYQDMDETMLKKCLNDVIDDILKN